MRVGHPEPALEGASGHSGSEAWPHCGGLGLGLGSRLGLGLGSRLGVGLGFGLTDQLWMAAGEGVMSADRHPG